MNKSLFNVIFGREPDPEEPSEDPRIKALEQALEMSEPGKAGTPWEHPDRKNKVPKEPEWI